MSINALGDISNANSNLSTFNIKKQASQTQGFQQAINDASKSKDDKKLMDSCKSFESYFIQTMYQEMQKTVDDSKDIVPPSQGEKIFKDMLTQEQSKNMTNAGGIGIADMMFKQMKKAEIAAEDPINAKKI